MSSRLQPDEDLPPDDRNDAEHLGEVAARLGAPAPEPGFRERLQHRLLSDGDRQARPPRLWTLASAYVAAGTVALVFAVVVAVSG
jgi:hypothetical protein